MNIKEFLDTNYSSSYCNTAYSEHNSYIEVHNSLIIGDDFTLNVAINEVLDVHDNCHLSNITIDKIINVQGSVHSTCNLLPGSFVGNFYHINEDRDQRVLINGYITQSGLIS